MLPYECGEQTIGPSWIKINAGFYTFGLIFLLFDIESIFLIPWALIIKEIGLLRGTNVSKKKIHEEKRSQVTFALEG